MPSMPRPNRKPKKIAYKIVGVPANINFRRSKEQEAINRRLVYEETDRSR